MPSHDDEFRLIRELWENAPDDDIVEALFVYPDDHVPAVREIILEVARARGLDNPDSAVLRRLRNTRDAAVSEAAEATACTVNGASLSCRICGFDRFRERPAQLNAAFATFLGLDWLQESVRCVVCARCGYIHWFAVEEATR